MSATGRTNVRRADDFYETPGWVTEAILPHLRHASAALDPCAGDGAILRVIADHRMAPEGFELDAARAASCRMAKFRCIHRDALSAPSWGRPDLIVTNPPFVHSQAFADRAIAEVRAGGDVAMLLRLNWLGGKARAAFHRKHPADVFVLSQRPSFTGGGTDATEYAWFVWGAGRGNRWALLDAPARGVR